MARNAFEHSYLDLAIDLAISSNCPAGKILRELIETDRDHNYSEAFLIATKNKIRSSSSTRRREYMKINTELTQHSLYADKRTTETRRIAATRLRLGSHRLKIETGRWSRIPVEQRLCPCGQVQSEIHVILECPLNKPNRDSHPDISFTDINSFFSSPVAQLCNFSHATLRLFETL